jgi:hypothetical protein
MTKKNLFIAGSFIVLLSLTACSDDSTTQVETTDTSPSTTVSQTTGDIIKQGSFVDAEHPTTGAVKVITGEDGKTYIEFGEDFKTDSGPDLFVVLHQSPDIIASAEPPNYGIEEGSYVTLAPLQSTSGTQIYEIPEDVNLNQYQSVAVWCRQFNATFGAASLQ